MPDYQFHTYAPDALVFNSSDSTFTLDADYDYREDRNYVEYSDDDGVFDGDQNNDGIGDDANQIGTAYDDAGNVIASGTVYAQEYAQLQAPDGTIITIDRIEIDGVHVGYIPSSPLTPGVTYSYVGGGNIGPSAGSSGEDTRMNHSYYETQSVPCFAAGTLIETCQSVVPVEQIVPGMVLPTVGPNPCEVRLVVKRQQDLSGYTGDGGPILIPAHTFGMGRPARDLVVSAQHRILVGHTRQGAAFAGAPCLVPAKGLLGLPGVRYMRGRRSITWIHLLCDRHDVIFAEGCGSETMLLGTQCLQGLKAMDRLRVLALFAGSKTHPDALNGPPRFPCATVAQARGLVRAAQDVVCG